MSTVAECWSGTHAMSLKAQIKRETKISEEKIYAIEKKIIENIHELFTPCIASMHMENTIFPLSIHATYRIFMDSNVSYIIQWHTILAVYTYSLL